MTNHSPGIPGKLSRRSFIKLSGTASLGMLVYACRFINSLTSTSTPTVTTQLTNPAAGGLEQAMLYYSGYATQTNMQWVEQFDVDVLVRGFLMFLNSTDAWVPAFQQQIEKSKQAGRFFLVGLQAAVLVENAQDLPSLGSNDPALAFPMETIHQWKEFACRTPDGATLRDVLHQGFSHACINNSTFREFFKGKLRTIIDSGVDGIHIDELQSRYFARHEGYCDACMEGMRNYLARKFSTAELNSRYGIPDIQSFDFRNRLSEEGNLQTPPASPLHKEWWLFQLTNLAEVEEDVLSYSKAYAQENGKEVILTSNSFEPEGNPYHVIEMTKTDFASIGTGMKINLRKEGHLVSTLRVPPDYSYIPLYRMAQGVVGEKPVTLFIDGPGGTSVMQSLPESVQRNIVRWAFAEAYAAGAFFHIPYPSLDYYAPFEACRQYVQFIQTNLQIYQDIEHLADVGILFSYASQIWDYWEDASRSDPNHNCQLYGLAQALTDLSIQYNTLFFPDGRVIPSQLVIDDLLKYPTILVPWVYALSEEHLQLLQEYAKNGGELVIFGELGTKDEEYNLRSTDVSVIFSQLGVHLEPDFDFEIYLNDPRSHEGVNILKELDTLITMRRVRVNCKSVTAQLNQKGNTFYCHLVNKALGESGFTPQRDCLVKIALPTDTGFTGTEATYMSPDQGNGEPTRLPLTKQGDTLEITIPELEVYAILSV